MLRRFVVEFMNIVSSSDFIKMLDVAKIVVFCFCFISSEAVRLHEQKLGKPEIPDGAVLPKDEWFTQNLDHFNPTITDQWQQRFFRNSTFYEESPRPVVFLMIGGEGEASPEWMVTGTWIEYAKKFKALCFQLEHRYYGKSHPTPDLGVKNLVYLNSEQALADLANFILWVNDEYKFDSNVKWVVFGGSYPGSLAAWMRLKYPHLVHIAVSSSGPLLAKADFMEYYQVVVESLRTSSQDCVDQVKEGMKQLSMLLKHRVGQRGVDTKFKLCDSIEGAGKLDQSSLYENIASNFAGIVQYNKDNRIGKSAKFSNLTIDLVCRLMTDQTAGTAIDRLANVNSLILRSYEINCLDYKYDNMIQSYRKINWNDSANEGGRQWMYQTCNEFGFYQTSGGEPEIFTNEFQLDFFTKQCSDIFGIKFDGNYLDNAIRRTNMMYGDLSITTDKIVYVHGSIDPWHALGITKTKDNHSPAIYIKGTAHCANMYPARDSDLPALRAARVLVEQLIDSWLDM